MIRKALLAALLPLCACATAQTSDDAPIPEAEPMPMLSEMSATVGDVQMSGEVIGMEGEIIGAVSLIQGPHGVIMEVTIEPGGLIPGWHGLHLHEVGDCSDIGVFKRSGGHMGMIEGGHGLMNPVGPESGDVPNIWAAADGSAGYETFSPLFTFDDVADEDGTAMVIHANRDDHITQPIGGAGPRVACAVIQ
ncbi:MAG: superoxide dismutase family protein [Henriciella sp.]|nr:superoxide dismutase family protein [Henriciella sp.]